ncbi:MAG: hypothetical protein ACHQFW_10585 [Chitinophagales bacterium]
MKTTLFPFIILSIISIGCFAQAGYNDAGSRTNAMGNTGVTFEDVYSAQNNQAGLAFVENISAGISTQNLYLVEGGINSHYGVFAMPIKKQGAFGLSLNYFGDNTFNQSKIGIGYGRKLAENVSVGIQLDYVGTKTIETGSGAAFTFDVGILYKPVSSLSVGAKVFNPIRAKTGLDYNEALPSIINIGLAYLPSEKITICAEGELNVEDNLRTKFGLEYHIVEQLFLRGGYISNPSMYTFGVGVMIKELKIDISSQFHQQLGMSPGLGLSYSF